MTRRATIRTAHADPDLVAGAIAPDNTDEMDMHVERDDGRRVVVTTIERDSTSGLQSTVDDTLVNLDVADQVASLAADVTGTDDATTDHDDPAEDESTDDQQQTDTNDTP